MEGVLALTQPVGVGVGQQLPFRQANPAAGSNLAYTFDGYGTIRILSLVFTVTLANAGANRLVTVEYRGKDALPFSLNEATGVQVINTAQRYSGSVWKTVSDFNTGTDVLFNLDAVQLFPGDSLNIVIASVDAGDTITNVRGVVERFPLNEDVLPTIEP